MLNEIELTTLLTKFQDLRILVIGDFYLDAYWYIDKTRSTLSLETPWHTNPVVEQHYSPGAAGTVTNNLKTLGVGTVYTLGVIGEDGFGDTLVTCLQDTGCHTDYLLKAPNWVTPTYLKPIHRGYEDILTEGPRFDIENRTSFPKSIEKIVLTALNECIPNVDGVIIGDQMPNDNLGIVTDVVREELCNLAVTYPEKVFFADSRTRIGKYRNVYIKPNRFEALRAVDPYTDETKIDIEIVERAAVQLAENTLQPVYVTLGKDGILVYHNEEFSHLPGIRTEEKTDPVGAGDSVSAGIVSTLCCLGSDSVVEAAYFGNLVASITITKIGTTGTASPEEVMEMNRRLNELN